MILAVFVVIWIAYGIAVCLELLEDKLIYTNIFGSFEMSWNQIERVETFANVRGNRSVVIFQKNVKERHCISVGMSNIRDEDLKQFLMILRSKAPQAKLSRDILELLK